MKNVAKYNIFKGVSTALTIGTPIATLACCGSFYKDSSTASLSVAGIFTILIALIFCKDKLAENFKPPNALMIATITLVLGSLIANIIECIQIVCIATIVTSGLDELTFKRFYKVLEMKFPKTAEQFKHFGFYFTTTKQMLEVIDEQKD